MRHGARERKERMKKKEISEINKIFTPANCCLTRICSCYVDAEKNKRAELKEAFLSLPEEEAFKYFNIFRGALSGAIAKNLINLEFTKESEEEGGAQELLLALREEGLQNEYLLNEFYDKVIESYDYGENYYIVLVHGIYDVPGRSSDGMDMYDASDFVYEFIQCAICPVKLTKGALSYNTDKNAVEARKRDWIVEAPDTGFLFPAFNDRQTDIHGTLLYAKKPDDYFSYRKVITEVLGANEPLVAGSQEYAFKKMTENVLKENCSFKAVKGVYEDVLELVVESDGEPAVIDLERAKKIWKSNGADQEQLNEFDDIDNDHFPELTATNVINTKSFNIKTEGLEIKVKPDYTHRVECRMIDGRPCVVMAVSDHLEVNGVTVRPVEISHE